MKTLVIHPKDPSTEFLKEIYKGQNYTIFTDHSYKISKEDFYKLVKKHDRIIMMGHGCPSGLFFSHINSQIVDILREKECIFIWCNADQFVKKHNLKGFFTGMFISEIGEGYYFGIRSTQEQIDISNKIFSELVGRNINESTSHIHQIVKDKYYSTCPVIQYNNQRLYYQDEESILNESECLK